MLLLCWSCVAAIEERAVIIIQFECMLWEAVKDYGIGPAVLLEGAALCPVWPKYLHCTSSFSVVLLVSLSFAIDCDC